MIKDIKWEQTGELSGCITGVYVETIEGLIAGFFNLDNRSSGPYVCHIIEEELWRNRSQLKAEIPVEFKYSIIKFPTVDSVVVEDKLLDGVERRESGSGLTNGISSLVSDEFHEKHSVMESEFWPVGMVFIGTTWHHELTRFRICMLNRYRMNHGDEFSVNFKMDVNRSSR